MASEEIDDSLLKFSLDLYKQVLSRKPDMDNVVCSPLAIAAAISALLVWARNETAEELFGVLHVEASVDRLRDHFSKLTAQLATYGPGASLRVVSFMYRDGQIPVKSGCDLPMRSFFATTVEVADFKIDPEGAREEANGSVELETALKVRDLIPAGVVDAHTAFVLLSAVYVQGFWQSPFQWRNTRAQAFYVDYENSIVVNMMYQDRSYRLGHSPDLRASALEIPCKGRGVSMVIVLPDAPDGLDLLQERLTPSSLRALLCSLDLVIDVQLTLPKFTLDSSIMLKDSLSALGAKKVFTPGDADLSGMFETDRPPVTDVVHRTFVQVDEGGMDAARWCAMTTLWCPATLPLHVTRFVVDHPFMFIIKGNEPDVIFCLGSVRRP
ncbi:hypothetical protein HPB50_010090 [Hyalomma asiaticum]|uniref:Uncharacterized protein n=1 Tax=Hyalomma asiaticum TaxID=266040 RepID=A0ACB7T9H9_HYAAI|nr:hypothetical protein HPB50_010090 [Hyalomma asiaticum]